LENICKRISENGGKRNMFLSPFARKIDIFLYKLIAPKIEPTAIQEAIKNTLWKRGTAEKDHFISKEEFEKYPLLYQHIKDFLNICMEDKRSVNNKITAINAFFVTLHTLVISYILLKIPNPHEHWASFLYLGIILIMCNYSPNLFVKKT
jgi:hypothetical protein